LLPAGCTPPLKVALAFMLVASIRPHLGYGGNLGLMLKRKNSIKKDRGIYNRCYE
jgi:hypothetical protein